MHDGRLDYLFTFFLPNISAPNKPVMEWSLRVKAACGSARGLAYLHEDCKSTF